MNTQGKPIDMDLDYSIKNYSIVITIGIFIFAVAASILGLTTFKIKLDLIADNVLIANFIFVSMAIAFNERILEVANSTFRKPGRLTLVNRLERAQARLNLFRQQNGNSKPPTDNSIAAATAESAEQASKALPVWQMGQLSDTQKQDYKDLEDEMLEASMQLAIYGNRTRRILLRISLVFSGVLGCLGCVNVLTPFVAYDAGPVLIEKALIDASSVVITAWIVAGGSEGWNSITRWAEGAFNPKKV